MDTRKSEILKTSIRDFCKKTLEGKRKRPYDLISDLIGQESSGKGDLAVKSEEILRKAFILGYELVRFIPKMLGVTQPSVSISVKRGEKIKRSPKASN